MTAKKLAGLLFLLSGLAVCAAAQEEQKRAPQEQAVIDFNQNRVDNTEKYKQFDYYYYAYALNELDKINADVHTREFLVSYKNYRSYIYGTTRYQLEGRNYVHDYNEMIDKLSKKAKNFTQEEKNILKEYATRPRTQDEVFKDSAKYTEYEEIVYKVLRDELKDSPTAQDCLVQVRTLREEASNTNVDLLAKNISRKDLGVLLQDFEGVMVCLQKLSGGEDSFSLDKLKEYRVKDYLLKPLSHHGQEYVIPVEEWKGFLKEKNSKH